MASGNRGKGGTEEGERRSRRAEWRTVTSHAPLISRLSRAVGQFPTSCPLPYRLCHAARDLLGADGAAITLENSTPARVTVCATDRRAERLEDLQDVLGEGPCPQAYAAGKLTTAPLGTAAAARWPEFAASARKIIGPAGVVWSVPLRPANQTLGTLSLYRLSQGPLAEPLDAAQAVADKIGALLLIDPQGVLDSPEGGWSSRAVVHQAAGMLIAQLGVHADGALAILRCYAFARGSELIHVARAVVERELDLSHA